MRSFVGGLCKSPQRRSLPRPDLPHDAAQLETAEHGPDLVGDAEPQSPVVHIPALGRDRVPGELPRVQGLRRGL